MLIDPITEFLSREVSLLERRGYIKVNGENSRPTHEFLTNYHRALSHTRSNRDPLEALKEAILYKGPATSDDLNYMLCAMHIIIEKERKSSLTSYTYRLFRKF